jgi:hypothetical protein
LGEHCVGFFTGKDRGKTLRALRPFHIVQGWTRVLADVSGQNQEGMQGAVRGGGGALLVEGEGGEKGAALGGPHVCGVTFVVQQEKAFDPTARGDFRVVTHMLEPEDESYLVESCSF